MTRSREPPTMRVGTRMQRSNRHQTVPTIHRRIRAASAGRSCAMQIDASASSSSSVGRHRPEAIATASFATASARRVRSRVVTCPNLLLSSLLAEVRPNPTRVLKGALPTFGHKRQRPPTATRDQAFECGRFARLLGLAAHRHMANRHFDRMARAHLETERNGGHGPAGVRRSGRFGDHFEAPRHVSSRFR